MTGCCHILLPHQHHPRSVSCAHHAHGAEGVFATLACPSLLPLCGTRGSVCRRRDGSDSHDNDGGYGAVSLTRGVVVLLGCEVLAIIVEWAQITWVTGRSGEIGDVVAVAFGSCIVFIMPKSGMEGSPPSSSTSSCYLPCQGLVSLIAPQQGSDGYDDDGESHRISTWDV